MYMHDADTPGAPAMAAAMLITRAATIREFMSFALLPLRIVRWQLRHDANNCG
jgi:hypothetical protein